MKKAQGLPISTVILAILGLLVLGILFAVTTGRLAVFSKGIQTCPTPCIRLADCDAPLPGQWLDPRDGSKCLGMAGTGPEANVCCVSIKDTN